MNRASNTQEHSNNLQDLLCENEEILFSEKPHSKSYFLQHFFKLFPLALINFCTCTFILSIIVMVGMLSEGALVTIIVFAVYILSLGPFWFWLYRFVLAISKHAHLEYLITNKRVLIKNGKHSSDIVIIDNAELINVRIILTKIDEKLKTGQVHIATHIKWLQLSSLTRYNEIGKHFERICAINEENAKPYNKQIEY